MLRWRLLLGAVLIAALVALVRLDFVTSPPGAWLFPLALLLSLLAAQEVVSLLHAGGYKPLVSVIYGGSLLVVASNAVPLFLRPVSDDAPLERLGWPLLAFTLSVLAALVGEMRRYRQPGGVMANLGVTIFGVAYVGLLLSFTVQLRALGGPANGMLGLLALILVVKLGDTGAYTVGRLIGKHKMSPHISPGKTLEGAGGAFLFASAGAWFAYYHLARWLDAAPPAHAWSWLVFGLVVGLAGLLGDLAESLLKRDVGRKDSSTWMPGFGGVLDLLDSILFAAPVAYLCRLLETF